MVDDGYAQYYADRLWNLLSAVYRTLDAGPGPNGEGPLRELINRIGNQAAVVRRSIDRLGENQSIETCDDWVIPYIGDLVATRIVSCLDAQAQRIDVAKTIYYRRRAGTVGLLEELAADIATRDARVVEFFRRMGRTRHQFDPPISYAIENPIDGPENFGNSLLEVAEGLIGAYSGTPAGGFADLRNPYAASNTGSAFDEYSYTADLRAGKQSLGRYNIRKLGVYLWWLQSFPIVAATPVVGSGTSPCYTFDPTGRDIPLFAPSQRALQSKLGQSPWGEHWVSPAEWQLPVAVRETLWKAEPGELYHEAFAVGNIEGGLYFEHPVTDLSIHPEKGRFSFVGLATPGPELVVNYSFGLMSRIGAGGYGQGILSELAQPTATVKVSSGTGLDAALAGVGDDVTVEIQDSLTYAGPAQSLTVPEGCTVFVSAKDSQRPVLRYTAEAEWVITGNGGANSGTETVLVLEGILLQGGDIVLRGNFDAVYLRMMTLDPGTQGTAPNLYDTAIDGVALAPANIFIEGAVTNLVLERCITGPIRERNGGAIEQMTATDSIIQAIPTKSAQPIPAWPGGDFALGFTAGTVSLSRCTVLGPSHTHRMQASECILNDVATVEDPQHGCVRFTAYATGSNLHQPYRCVRVAPAAALFETRKFGQPEYAKLRDNVDAQILAPKNGTISEGAQNGSEMGVYCLEAVPLQRRGLALKYDEFLPIGQQPVWIDVN